MDNTKIKNICMGSVYSADYRKAYDFYIGVLGLDGGDSENAKGCYINVTDKVGLYIEGGYEKPVLNEKSARTTFSFEIDSAGAMFRKLQDAGIKILQSNPVKMGENIYWFQCNDFEGNIVEFLGAE